MVWGLMVLGFSALGLGFKVRFGVYGSGFRVYLQPHLPSVFGYAQLASGMKATKL